MMIARAFSIPLSILQSFAIIYFPKLLIDMITQKVSVSTMLGGIGAFCLILLACDIGKHAADTKTQGARYSAAFQVQNLTQHKFLTTDYENTDNPSVEAIRHRAVNWETCVACQSPQP